VADELGTSLIVQSWLYGGNMGPICEGNQVIKTTLTFSHIILVGRKSCLFVFLTRGIRHAIKPRVAVAKRLDEHVGAGYFKALIRIWANIKYDSIYAYWDVTCRAARDINIYLATVNHDGKFSHSADAQLFKC
jgi:hypothetical protein